MRSERADRDLFCREDSDSSAVVCAMAAHEKAGMGPRSAVTPGGMRLSRHFQVALNDERPMAEEAAAMGESRSTFVAIGPNDALTDLDRILDDNDDVYIGLPSAPWLIYQELRRQKVVVIARWPRRR